MEEYDPIEEKENYETILYWLQIRGEDEAAANQRHKILYRLQFMYGMKTSDDPHRTSVWYYGGGWYGIEFNCDYLDVLNPKHIDNIALHDYDPWHWSVLAAAKDVEGIKKFEVREDGYISITFDTPVESVKNGI